MARIIENQKSVRRIIKLSTDDILSIVRFYQTATRRGSGIEEIRNCLEDTVMYIPEDV